MKKVSSSFVRYVLPMSILACTISSTVKPMEIPVVEVNKKLTDFSLQCNFKDFQVEVLKNTSEDSLKDVKVLADQGHFVALWTKLMAWDGKLVKQSKVAEVDEFFTDLMKFFVVLGVNCAQYYNFTNNHEQASHIYILFKNHVMKTFGLTIGQVAASSSLSYNKLLNEIHYWLENSLNEVFLPSCGWVANAEIVWNKTGVFSGGFYTVKCNDKLVIDEFGSPQAVELAQLHFADLSKTYIQTVLKNQTWVEFMNSFNDIVDALNIAAQSISQSVQALDVIKKNNQEIEELKKELKKQEEEWNEQVLLRDSKILNLNAVVQNQSIDVTCKNQNLVLKNLVKFDTKKLKKVTTQKNGVDQKTNWEKEAHELRQNLVKRFEGISTFDRQNLKIATTSEKGLTPKQMYEQEINDQAIDKEPVEILAQDLSNLNIDEEIIEQNK